jgi:hypothetical protein
VVKPKTFEGNKPETVKPDAAGSLKLTAVNCAIHGPSLVFEQQYTNLGDWSSPDDRAVWTVVVPRAGRYEVWLDYACDNGAAGNTFVIQSGNAKLTGQVVGTRKWDAYRQVQVGTLSLQAGERPVTMRSEGAIKGALLDLRAIRLVPVK